MKYVLKVDFAYSVIPLLFYLVFRVLQTLVKLSEKVNPNVCIHTISLIK